LAYLLRSVQFSADLKSEFTGFRIQFVFLDSVGRAVDVGGRLHDVDAAELRRLDNIKDHLGSTKDRCVVINVDYLDAHLYHLSINHTPPLIQVPSI